MSTHRLLAGSLASGVVVIGVLGALASAPSQPEASPTIWVANRGAHTIRGFDARTGEVLQTIPMAANSQPGDLAFAKGKLYVAEEFGTPPAIAIVDARSGAILNRITFATAARPHHVHASNGGNLIAVGLFGTDNVAVIDTRDDSLLGPWDSNPLTTNGRVHAAVFSKNGQRLYLASDASNEVIAIDPRTGEIFWRMTIPAAHEIEVTDNDKFAYVSRRTANRLAVIDLEARTFHDVLTLGLPDTLRLTANEKMLTVGLRTSPAQLAVVDTETFAFTLVNLSAANEATTIGGHQWTSPGGAYTFASFEGGANPGVAVINHWDGHQVILRLPYPGRPHGVDRAVP